MTEQEIESGGGGGRVKMRDIICTFGATATAAHVTFVAVVCNVFLVATHYRRDSFIFSASSFIRSFFLSIFSKCVRFCFVFFFFFDLLPTNSHLACKMFTSSCKRCRCHRHRHRRQHYHVHMDFFLNT